MARFKLGFPANPQDRMGRSRCAGDWQINMHFILLITIIDLILFTLDSVERARLFGTVLGVPFRLLFTYYLFLGKQKVEFALALLFTRALPLALFYIVF